MIFTTSTFLNVVTTTNVVITDYLSGWVGYVLSIALVFIVAVFAFKYVVNNIHK